LVQSGFCSYIPGSQEHSLFMSTCFKSQSAVHVTMIVAMALAPKWAVSSLS
jgi:hypothetical protein